MEQTGEHSEERVEPPQLTPVDLIQPVATAQAQPEAPMGSKMLRKSTSFNLPVELLERLRVACALRGTNQTEIVIRGIEEFIDAKARPTLVPKKINPDNQRWHDQLEEVLESGVHTASDLAQHAITAAGELVQANRRLVGKLEKGRR